VLVATLTEVEAGEHLKNAGYRAALPDDITLNTGQSFLTVLRLRGKSLGFHKPHGERSKHGAAAKYHSTQSRLKW